MNHIEQITIRGFKSIRELNNFDLNNIINIFIGANGSGKSNLISYFELLHSIVSDNFFKYVLNSGGAEALLFKGLAETSEIYIETISEKGGYKFSLYPDSKNNLKIVEQNSEVLFDAIQSRQIYHFHDTGKRTGMRNYEIVQDNKFLRSKGENIAPFLYKLKHKYPHEYEEILDALRIVIPFFHDFVLDIEQFGQAHTVNLSWYEKNSNYPLQPYQFSDGSLRFICMATALLQPNPPATIILDEPELGLHPAAIAVLAELIYDAATRSQLIIATQSPTLIDYFSIRNIIVVNRENGTSTYKRLHEKEFNMWLEQYSIGDLWRKNIIQGRPINE